MLAVDPDLGAGEFEPWLERALSRIERDAGMCVVYLLIPRALEPDLDMTALDRLIDARIDRDGVIRAIVLQMTDESPRGEALERMRNEAVEQLCSQTMRSVLRSMTGCAPARTIEIRGAAAPTTT